ncbi:MAG: alpha/beta hydrolase [Polyangiales bacterium]
MASTRQEAFDLAPPSRLLRPLEARAFFEFGSLFPRAPELLAQPRGDGRPVVLMPGFLADDRSTWPLRRYLSHLGYKASGWGLGRNNGNPEACAEAFESRLDSHHRDDAPLTLIGWSLGGVVARVIAMQRPERVREVITMGTPVEGGPKYTTTGDFYARRQGLDLDSFEQHVHEANQAGLRQPLTVIYSRTDAIVGWRAAIDRYNPQARHVEVRGSHLGLGVSPQVWRTIATTLYASR